jgi:hypothetical protein
MTTDYRALCAELIDALDSGISTKRMVQSPLIARARAALAEPEPVKAEPDADHILRLAEIIRMVDGNHDKGANALAEAILSHPGNRWLPRAAQPEPVGATNHEIDDLAAEHLDGDRASTRDFARAVLARWGRPAITPIPVSERLPGAEDCDAEGRCWWHAPHRVSAAHWIYRRKGRWPEQQYTRWLPANALPLPEGGAA